MSAFKSFLIAATVLVFLLGFWVGTAKALAPATACTSANRMDIFVDEDNIMYECQCQVLKIGTLCAWQVIGGVEAVSTRKKIRRHYHIRVIPTMRLVIL